MENDNWQVEQCSPTQAAGGVLIDAQVARRGLAFALPAIVAALDDPHVSGTACLSIVVLDPACTRTSGDAEPAVLWEYAIGRERWDADYAAFARVKALDAWRAWHEGECLLRRGVATLQAGGSLRGSAVLDGIVVAVSGAHPWYDEGIALTVAAWLRAAALERQHESLAKARA